MKIIQVVAAPEGDSDGIETALWGLGDDGILYEWRGHQNPWVRGDNGRRVYVNEAGAKEKIAAIAGDSNVIYSDGHLAGWYPMLNFEGHQISRPLVNPFDPSRHNRS